MTVHERLIADYCGTGLTLGPHPMALKRQDLASKGVWRASELSRLRNGRRVRVAGGVIVRQRPSTAGGFIFLSLEDETGIANIIVQPQIVERNRLIIVSESFLVVEGILQNQDGVTSVRAEKFRPIDGLGLSLSSHDFC